MNARITSTNLAMLLTFLSNNDADAGCDEGDRYFCAEQGKDANAGAASQSDRGGTTRFFATEAR